MKIRIYEIHIFELRNEEINVKKILAVIHGKLFTARVTHELLTARVGLIYKTAMFGRLGKLLSMPDVISLLSRRL